MSEWISVNDRLPEFDKQVLVLIDGTFYILILRNTPKFHTEFFAYYPYCSNKYPMWYSDDKDEFYKPISNHFWFPIPKPPEEV